MIGLLGFDFLRGELWPLFGLVLMFLLLGMASLAWRRAARERVADKHLLNMLAVNYSSNRARLRLGFEATAMVLIVLSILGPVRGYTEVPVVRKGLDIVVCLDTSRSMLARDLAPDRLERARREVRSLLDNLAGDRIALVAFSGDAREIAPLTRDRSALLSFLERVSPADNRIGGTSLGAALEYSLTIFDGRTGAHEAIVVLTDGEDLEGEGLAVARRAKEQGIGIYVVGLGTEQGGKIPIMGRRGAERFVRGPDGEEVVTRLDRESLAQLATVTGGAFLTTSDSPTPLQEMYAKRISKLDRRDMGGGDERVPHDRYQWALVPGVLFALLALATRERRPARVIARVLANGRRVASLVLIPVMLVASFGAGNASAQEVPIEIPPIFPEKNPQAAMVLEHVIASVREERHMEALVWLQFALGTDAPTLSGDPVEGQNVGGEESPTEEEQNELKPRFVWTDLERAHLRYALGIVEDLLGYTSLALEDFRAAAALAGPGELRTRGLYNRGTIQLLVTEEKRDEFIQEAQAQAGGGSPMPPMPSVPGAPEEEPEDPVEVLRAGYGKAREFLLEHLKLDSTHVDTRANLELIVRRLRELDAIEEQREEEQEEEQEDSEESEESEDSEEKEDEESEPEEDSESEPEESEEQDDPEDSEEPKDSEEESEGEPEPSEEEDSEEEQGKPDEEEPDEEQEQPVAMELEDMTSQELARLLDELSDLEKKQVELQRRLQRARQVPVERDW